MLFKRLFLATFIFASIPVGVVACNKDKKEESDKKKKSDDDDDKADKKKSKKDDDSSDDDDDSKSKKKKHAKKDDSDDDDDSKSKKAKDEDGDSKKKDDDADDDDSTGVKACDEYLTRYMKCMPGDSKTKKDAVKKMRDAWKQAATSSAGKDALKTACKQADEGLDKVPTCSK